MKKLLIDGNLAKDAEILTSKGGRTYVRLVVGNRVFNNNEESTDWVEVYSFDQNIIEKRAAKLLKGCKVVVQGDCYVTFKVHGGQAYLNTKVMADWIEMVVAPKKSSADTATVSTYTATTDETKEVPDMPVVPSVNSEAEAVDDLPF